jgi:hypothetical protein
MNALSFLLFSPTSGSLCPTWLLPVTVHCSVFCCSAGAKLLARITYSLSHPIHFYQHCLPCIADVFGPIIFIRVHYVAKRRAWLDVIPSSFDNRMPGERDLRTSLEEATQRARRGERGDPVHDRGTNADCTLARCIAQTAATTPLRQARIRTTLF